MILIWLFAVRLGWLPTGPDAVVHVRRTRSGSTRLKHFVLPVFVTAFVSLIYWVRYQRASMLEVLHQDYIRTARAKGLSERRVILRHAWRNSLIPIATLLGFSVPIWWPAPMSSKSSSLGPAWPSSASTPF